MRDKDKITYEKPTAVSLGPAGSVRGQDCTNGTAPSTNVCTNGVDPSSIPTCDDGSTATGNCYPLGGVAGQACLTVGDNAVLGCMGGNFP